MPPIQSHKVLDYLPDVNVLQRGLLKQTSAERTATVRAARLKVDEEAERQRVDRWVVGFGQRGLEGT